MGSSSDQKLINKEDAPYNIKRYKEIIKERYLISKNLNTSYTDLGKITPYERRCLIEFLAEDAQRAERQLKEKKKELTQRSNN